jgi:hypothetical protein
VGVAGGTLSGRASTGDPQVQHLHLGFNAAEVPSIAVRLKSTSAGGIQFYWGTTATNSFSSAQLLTVDYTNPPDWQTLVYAMSNHAGWSGKTVTRMRFDPGSVAGAEFQIDWIRASDGSPADRLGFAVAAPSGGTSLEFRFNGDLGRTYVLESATHLPAGQWSVVQTLGPLPVGGGQVIHYDASTHPEAQRFFRMRVSP